MKAGQYPAGTVARSVNRSQLPKVFNEKRDYDEEREPYLQVARVNIVVVGAGPVTTQVKSYSLDGFAFVYSAKSGRVYEWVEYYPDCNTSSVMVSGGICLVECVPNGSHSQPPKAVNVHASTAGVAWLAVRAVEMTTAEWREAVRLTELEDAPFGAYLDMVDELEIGDETRAELRAKLELFFGAGGGS